METIFGVLFMWALGIGIVSQGLVFLIPGTSLLATPFVIAICARDKGWHQGVRAERWYTMVKVMSR